MAVSIESLKRRKLDVAFGVTESVVPTPENARLIITVKQEPVDTSLGSRSGSGGGPAGHAVATKVDHKQTTEQPRPQPPQKTAAELMVMSPFGTAPKTPALHSASTASTTAAVATPYPKPSDGRPVATASNVSTDTKLPAHHVNTAAEIMALVNKKQPMRHRIPIAGVPPSPEGPVTSAAASVVGFFAQPQTSLLPYLSARPIREALKEAMPLERLADAPPTYKLDKNARMSTMLRMLAAVDDVNKSVQLARVLPAMPAPLSSDLKAPLDTSQALPDVPFYTSAFEDMLLFEGGVDRASPTNLYQTIRSPPCSNRGNCVGMVFKWSWIPSQDLTNEKRGPFELMAWMSPTELAAHHKTGEVPKRPMGPCLLCSRKAVQTLVLAHTGDQTTARGIRVQEWHNSTDEDGYRPDAMTTAAKDTFNGQFLPVAGFSLKYLKAMFDSQMRCRRINQDAMKVPKTASASGSGSHIQNTTAAIGTTAGPASYVSAVSTMKRDGGVVPPPYQQASTALKPPASTDPTSVFHN